MASAVLQTRPRKSGMLAKIYIRKQRFRQLTRRIAALCTARIVVYAQLDYICIAIDTVYNAVVQRSY